MQNKGRIVALDILPIDPLPGVEFIVFDKSAKREGFRAVREKLAGRKFCALLHMQVALRSQDELPGGGTDIYVADTIGELGLFYRIAPVVFMGGSLVPHGGQNPIEGIKLGAAILHGPHVFNFSDIYESLDQAGGAGSGIFGHVRLQRTLAKAPYFPGHLAGGVYRVIR